MFEQILAICFGIWLYFTIGLIVTRIVFQEEEFYEFYDSYITIIVSCILWPLTILCIAGACLFGLALTINSHIRQLIDKKGEQEDVK